VIIDGVAFVADDLHEWRELGRLHRMTGIEFPHREATRRRLEAEYERKRREFLKV